MTEKIRRETERKEMASSGFSDLSEWLLFLCHPERKLLESKDLREAMLLLSSSVPPPSS
jgi:hypothetical protein